MDWAQMNLGMDAYRNGPNAINPFANANQFNPSLLGAPGLVGAVANGRNAFDQGFKDDLYARTSGAQKALPSEDDPMYPIGSQHLSQGQGEQGMMKDLGSMAPLVGNGDGQVGLGQGGGQIQQVGNPQMGTTEVGIGSKQGKLNQMAKSFGMSMI